MSPVGRLGVTGHGVAWMIGGTAGEGLESGGESFARALAVTGQRPTTQRDFPSRIRGGDTTFTVRLTPQGHLAPPRHIDLALAFNDTVVPRMDARLGEGSLLLLDEGRTQPFVSAHGAEVATFPFTQIATDAGMPRAKNMVALGASAALLGLDVDALATTVAKRFARKGDDVVAANKDAVLKGHAEAVERFGGPRFQVPDAETGGALFLSGNEAACLGALAAGCRVAAAYPITPASDVLEYLTPRLQELGGVAIQLEDEMAALNVVAGAGFAGAKALTATSGPGLSLMTETLGMMGSMEVPGVILDCQRPGPSTGMPTKHGQDDLWHMVHGGAGEGVRVALAPTDVKDAFHATSEAFRLSEMFRCPAIVGLDQQACMFKQTVEPFDMAGEAARHGTRAGPVEGNAWDGTYAPYGGDGEAQRVALPGEPGGIHYSNSTEHGPAGFTNEVPAIRNAMVERRLRRMEHIIDACQDPIVVTGPEDADTVLVTWGSTTGACLEAQERLAARDVAVRVVAIRLLWPFPRQAVAKAIGDARVFVVEANGFAQMARLLKSELPVHDRCRSILRYDGTPVISDDILGVVA